METLIQWLETHNFEYQICEKYVLWQTDISIGIYNRETRSVDWCGKFSEEKSKNPLTISAEYVIITS